MIKSYFVSSLPCFLKPSTSPVPQLIQLADLEHNPPEVLKILYSDKEQCYGTGTGEKLC